MQIPCFYGSEGEKLSSGLKECVCVRIGKLMKSRISMSPNSTYQNFAFHKIISRLMKIDSIAFECVIRVELIDLVENTPENLSKKKVQRGETFNERELNNNDASKDKEEVTYYDQTIKKLKNKKLTSWIIIISIVFAGIAAALHSWKDIMDFFKNKSSTPSKIETSK